MNFFPSGVTASGSVKGVDYYDRIRGVLDRLAERRNSIEAAIADAFVNELEHLQKVDVDRDKSVNPRKRKEEEDRNKGVNPRKRKEGEFASAGASLDLSWKQGGRNFPKKHSRIGPAYQVSEIPKLRGEKNDTEARCASL